MQPIKNRTTLFHTLLAGIYWVITSLRNWCYDIGILKSTVFDIPIISVGNLAVGGSGKTPMVEYLLDNLQDTYTIATLSRGYGRKTKGFRWVEANQSYTETGDEPLQIKSKYKHISVAVCESRVIGVQQILAEKPKTNLIILDDAFQHRAIGPSTQLLLSTYEEPYYKDYLLPAGRLREKRKGAERADATIYTKCPPNFKPLTYGKEPIFHSFISYQNPEIKGPIYGFSGLAKNHLFAKHLADSFEVQGFEGYKDHYSFTQKDLDSLIQKAKGATLVCTEKDWIKVKGLSGSEKIKFVSIKNTIQGEIDFMEWLKSHMHLEWAFNTIGSSNSK
ncbi:tetraacyldisaccharide 4'-kinase [Bacteroidia bacterium]|nr:tetraacyldisaccharide 4'-kinase [Bacteroidia bacterium]MDC1395825.1 tetraacyldisaccharide 4'-kinase [Bacteroidia bacterium]